MAAGSSAWVELSHCGAPSVAHECERRQGSREGRYNWRSQPGVKDMRRALICALAVVAIIVSAGAAEPQLIGHWVFDAAHVKGAVLKAVAGPDGKLVGNPELGKSGGLSFVVLDGDDDSTVLPPLPEALKFLPRGAFSVEAIVAVNVPQEWGCIIGAFQDNRSYEKGWLLGVRNDRFCFAVSTKGADDGDGVLTYMVADKPFQPGKFYHLVGVYDGRRMKLYVDGRLAASSQEQSGNILYPPRAFFEIGAYHDADEYYRLSGAIAEIRLYSGALAEQQIAQRFGEVRPLLTAVVPRVRILAGPYIMHTTPTSTVIMWETDLPSTSEVFYGLAAPVEKRVAAKGEATIHEVRITGLTPGTIYFYQVRSRTAAGGVVRSKLYSFKTAPGREVPFTFVVVGDTRTYPKRFQRICELAWGERPDLVVNVGDVVSNGNVKQQWLTEWLIPAAVLMHRVPMYVAIGNHERNAKWFYRYVSYPEPENYYSFDWSNAHFTMIDTNQDIRPRSEQYRWIERDLASAKATWKFAFHHHPQWSSDSNDYGDAYRGPSELGDKDTRVLCPLYERYGVDIVFYGHIHDYERTWPIRGGKIDPDGVIYVQTGGGGAELEDFAPYRSWFTAALYRGWQYCVVTVNGRRLRMVVKDIEGRMVDWLELAK